MVQSVLAASGLTQLLVWAKFPLVEMPVMVNGAVPALYSVTALGALVVPSA
jgi:hypothetical protein